MEKNKGHVQMSNTSDLKSFHYLENGDISFSIYNTLKSTTKLDPGSYNIQWLEEYPAGRVKLEKDFDTESIKDFKFPEQDKIDQLFKSFFNENVKTKQKELGFYHKTGIILHGEEGCGKTTIIKHYANKFIDKQNAIVFHINKYLNIDKVWEFIIKIRAIQTNPIVIITDEYDEHVKENRYESYWKSILDGKNSIDNVIFLAATNYLDRIPEAIKTRPSRFKYCIKIEGVEDKNTVYSIISNMLKDNYSDVELTQFTNEMIGENLDVIKSFCNDKLMNLDSYKHPVKKKIGF